MYNDRAYLDRTRRSYWLGDKYYYMVKYLLSINCISKFKDNKYYLATRDTCAYKLNETERANLQYEDGTQIYDVIYQ